MMVHFAALMFALVTSGARSQELAPDLRLKAAIAEVISLAQQPRGHLNAARISETRETIERKILPLFDFERMTRAAMARNWTMTNAAQRTALTREFSELLVRTYSAALRNYRNEKIEYLPLRLPQGATQATVKTVVKRGARVWMSIDYDMEETPAGWKIYEIHLDGVDVVANFRGTFASKIRNAGVDGLIQALAKKNGNYFAAGAHASVPRDATAELSRANVGQP